MKKIVVAFDSFKGSLSSVEAAEAIKAYDAAVAAGTGADEALANITNYVASLDDARTYANALNAKAEAETALKVLKEAGEDAYVIGEVIKSEDGVIID